MNFFLRFAAACVHGPLAVLSQLWDKRALQPPLLAALCTAKGQAVQITAYPADAACRWMASPFVMRCVVGMQARDARGAGLQGDGGLAV